MLGGPSEAGYLNQNRNSHSRGDPHRLGSIRMTIKQRIPIGLIDSPPRSSSGDAIDRCRRNIGEGPTDIRCFQAQTFKQRPGDRASRAVGKLVECSTMTKMRERPVQDRMHPAQRHGQDRQAADNSTHRRLRVKWQPAQPSSVHLNNSCRWKAVAELVGKLRAVLDQHQIFFRDTPMQQGLCKDPRTRTQFNDCPRLRGDFGRYERRKRTPGRCNGSDPKGGGKPCPEKQERISSSIRHHLFAPKCGRVEYRR